MLKSFQHKIFTCAHFENFIATDSSSAKCWVSVPSAPIQPMRQESVLRNTLHQKTDQSSQGDEIYPDMFVDNTLP